MSQNRYVVVPTVTVLAVMKARLVGAVKGHALLKKKADALTVRQASTTLPDLLCSSRGRLWSRALQHYPHMLPLVQQVQADPQEDCGHQGGYGKENARQLLCPDRGKVCSWGVQAHCV